jgi:hypothetical protein
LRTFINKGIRQIFEHADGGAALADLPVTKLTLFSSIF